MLPDFRFIAISVVATIVIVMLGFGLFATLRVANQASAKLSPRGETTIAQVFPESAPALPRLEPPGLPPEDRASGIEVLSANGVVAGAETSLEEARIAALASEGNLPATESVAPVGGPLVPVDEAPNAPARSIVLATPPDDGPADVTGSSGAGPGEPVVEPGNTPVDIVASVAETMSPTGAERPDEPQVTHAVQPTTTTGASRKPVAKSATPLAKKRLNKTVQVRKPRVRHVMRAPANPAQAVPDPNNPFANWFVPPQTPARRAGS